MSDPFEKVRAFIDRHSMLEAAGGVLVAVSGGPDSVALLDMLARLNRGGCLHVAHLDHGLRGRQSCEDAEFVCRLAARLGLDATVESADVRAEAGASGRGIEEVARELRYGFLLRVATAKGLDRIATGHTMNDQAETLLMRLARGSGLRGLAAMRAVSAVPASEADDSLAEIDSSPRPQTTDPRPLLIRPLLSITREEVEQYCLERGLEFRTDPSNLSDDYTRNRVRHEVLPALKRINPRVVENIARATEIISEDEDSLRSVAASMLDQSKVGSATGVSKMAVGSEVFAYSVPEILARPSGLRRRMIIEAVSRARATSQDGLARAQMTSKHVAIVEGLLEQQASGSRVQLPGGLEVWREFDALVFKSIAAPPPVEEAAYEFDLSAARPGVRAGGFEISFERGLAPDLLDEMISEARGERERGGRDWMFAALDDPSLPARLVVRPRRAGEQARVLGHQKTIKLKNLMIGHRIPTSRRATWPVVVTPDDRYVWSPGLPPAVEFAAHGKAKSLARLRASII